MIIENAQIELNDFNLHIPYLDLSASVTLVSGQNGVGKSTLLKAILGIYPIMPVLKSSNIEFGYVPQDYRKVLLPWLSAEANLHLFESSETLKEKLFASGFKKSDLVKKPKYLSGGQCQRIAIIREVSMEIDYLILDEPFSGLDVKTIPIMADILSEFIKKGKKIILTSHIDLPNGIKNNNSFQEVFIERTNDNLATLKLNYI